MFLYMNSLISTLLNIRGGSSADLWGSPSVRLFLFVTLSCGLQPTWYSQLSASSLSLRFLFPAPQPGSSLKASSWDDHRLTSFVSCLSRITVLCCQVSWKLLFFKKIFCLFLFVCLRQEGKSNPITILGKGGNLLVFASYHRFLISASLSERPTSEGRVCTLGKLFWEEENSLLCIHLTNFPSALGECRKNLHVSQGSITMRVQRRRWQLWWPWTK